MAEGIKWKWAEEAQRQSKAACMGNSNPK